MTANMSVLNAPDRELIARAAGALGVDESFVEKDWFVVQAIAELLATANADVAPVFSGGTSLLKGHRLISRFSEDVDFKLALSSAFAGLSRNQRRGRLSLFRDKLVDCWAARGFEIASVQTLNENAFIKIELAYPTRFADHLSLRPNILAEMTARSPRLPPVPRPIRSFVAEFQSQPAELESVSCVDPVETAADKLSALAWRTVARDRSAADDDTTIVRHVYDLASLQPLVSAAPGFASLACEVMADDSNRGGGAVASLGPSERLREMMGHLNDDRLYRAEYRQFAEGMTFAGEDATLGFDDALEAVVQLCGLIDDRIR